MERLSFSFDGFDFKDLLTIEKVENPVASNVKNNLIETSMMNGGIFLSSKREPKYITVYFNYKNNVNPMKELLARYLYTEDVAELIISDNPKRMYYAKLDGLIEHNEGIGKCLNKVLRKERKELRQRYEKFMQ